MRFRWLSGAALIVALAAILLPGSALPVAQIHEHAEGLADYDSRTGKAAPTRAQRARAKALEARVTWGRFGTPSSVVRRGRFLARGVRGRTAASAARSWLRANRGLFGLASLDGLRLESANRLGGGAAIYSVNFRQVFKGLPASDGGQVTIAVSRGRKARSWNIGYVSSTLTRDTALTGSVRLTAAGGWVRAAAAAKLTRSVTNILSRKRAGRWTHLGVAGLGPEQLVRLVAFPTVREGVIPAYEAIVQDAKNAKGYRSFVDARTGRLLLRHSIVHNAASGLRQLAVTTTPFSGTLPAVDGGCGPNHPIAVPAGIRALSGFADTTNPLTDIVLELLAADGTTVLIHADTVFTPERFRFEPSGGVPAGSYFVRVCTFAGGGVPPEPRTYEGTLTLDDTPAPPAYWARWATPPASFPLGTLDADPWGRPATDTREIWCWRAAPGCDRVVANLASRAPWDHDVKLDQPTFTTRGNNAWSAESATHQNTPAPFQFMPTSAGRDYVFPWTDTWNQTDCDNSAGYTPGVSYDVSASVTSLFVAHNRMHDWAYNLGMTEQNWTAQESNFGLTEQWQQNDPVRGNAQAGAAMTTAQAFATGARNNANMATVPDGGSSVTNMYLWQPQAGAYYPPCADGNFDMPVIGHEYGHMIENRLIGKGVARAPFPFHTSPMGESHGDLIAAEYMNEYGFFAQDTVNRFAVGTYDTGNRFRGIRNYSMNMPMSGGIPEPGKQLYVNSLQLGDLGYDVTGPQQHADGEIFSAVNYTLRQLLVEKYDDDYPAGDQSLQEDCADGLVTANRCPGNRRWAQLMFDAMLIMPFDASMLQARDALLAADVMRFGGANQKELWLGYARRGFGRNAAGGNLLTNSDLDPVPDFEPVGTTPATVRFKAKNTEGQSVNARIYVGHYEARVSPIADTNPATPAAGTPATVVNFDDTAKFAPGQYEFVAHAPGQGHVRFRERFRSGENETIEIVFPMNWASAANGATATTTDGGVAGSLIDDTEATNWAAPATNTGGTLGVDGKRATIDLGGTEPIRVKYVQVSAHIGPGANRFAALRQFELWACRQGGTPPADCSTDSGYRRVYTSPAAAFPGDAPRPVAPQLILRRFDVPDFTATHVRLVVRTTQCTGASQYQGDQDADPLNDPDCDTNVPGNSTRNFARTAELQVFRAFPDIRN